jgi:hypothetical protein
VEFTLHPKQLAVIDEDMKLVVEPGAFSISVGGLLPGTTSPTTGSITQEMKLVGENYRIER